MIERPGDLVQRLDLPLLVVLKLLGQTIVGIGQLVELVVLAQGDAVVKVLAGQLAAAPTSLSTGRRIIPAARSRSRTETLIVTRKPSATPVTSQRNRFVSAS